MKRGVGKTQKGGSGALRVFINEKERTTREITEAGYNQKEGKRKDSQSNGEQKKKKREIHQDTPSETRQQNAKIPRPQLLHKRITKIKRQANGHDTRQKENTDRNHT